MAVLYKTVQLYWQTRQELKKYFILAWSWNRLAPLYQIAREISELPFFVVRRHEKTLSTTWCVYGTTHLQSSERCDSALGFGMFPRSGPYERPNGMVNKHGFSSQSKHHSASSCGASAKWNHYGKSTCSHPDHSGPHRPKHKAMNPHDFENLYKKVKNKAFKDDQMELLSVGVVNNYFTCKQTARLMSIFTWDDEKMKVLRMISNRICIDRNNSKKSSVHWFFIKTNMHVKYWESLTNVIQPKQHTKIKINDKHARRCIFLPLIFPFSKEPSNVEIGFQELPISSVVFPPYFPCFLFDTSCGMTADKCYTDNKQ